jgi:hypothetical protein
MQTAVLHSARKTSAAGQCGPVSGEFGDLSSPALYLFGQLLLVSRPWSLVRCPRLVLFPQLLVAAE